MKLILLMLTSFMTFNLWAADLNCSLKDDISAIVSYNEFYCSGDGEQYEVTIGGIGANLRDVKNDSDNFVISCPRQNDPAGTYYGLRLGVGIAVGVEGAVFGNIFEGN